MEVSLANGQSYTLPKPHVAADKPIVAYLDRLLRGSEGPSFLSVADFGAGVGQYGHALRSIDARHRWTGYDGAGNIEEATGGYVGWFDLTVPLSLPRADWVLSLEVGEHIPPEHEMMMVRNLHAHNCRGVVLSWAYLGKYGVGHVNNHGRAYLIPLFEELGYRHNRAASRALQRGRPKVPGRQIDLTRNVSQPWFWLRSVEVRAHHAAARERVRRRERRPCCKIGRASLIYLSASITPSNLYRAASIAGVSPAMLTFVLSAPAATSCLTKSTRLLRAAMWSGVSL